MNKEYKLKNLNCAHCASIIENNVAKLDYIDKVYVDFINKKIYLTFNNLDYRNHLSDIESIINRIEANITIEDIVDSYEFTFNLKNLNCANCASKIEKQIQSLNYITKANIDFINKKVIIKSTINDSVTLLEDLKNIINKIEHNVEISQEKIIGEENKIKFPKKILFAGTLFLIGLLLENNALLSFILYFISYIILAKDILLDTAKSLKNGFNINENTLISIATISAFVIGEIPEAIAVILFYSVGEYFQEYAISNSKKSISSLLKLKPEYANLIVNNEIKKVSPETVKIGDTISVNPGEKIPLYGIILEGESYLNTIAITGESVPRKYTKNEEVLSGFINGEESLKIKVTKDYTNSTITKILDLVENANKSKATTEKFITKFARVYTPVVVLIAILIAIIPPFFITSIALTEWIYRALTFLVISCPCALVLSIPLGFFSGIGGAAKNGILFKGSTHIEQLSKINVAVFDKTGTLTEGVFEITNIHLNSTYSKEELLELAAYAESNSNHPIAKSIIRAYNQKFDLSKVKKIKEIPGHGIEATINDDAVLVGNAKLLNIKKIDFNESEDNGTIIYIAKNNTFLGSITIADKLKENTSSLVDKLKKAGIKETIMLTGDKKSIGEYVGNQLGFDKIHTDLLPTDKAEIVENLIKYKDKKVAFIGDGINDAPVIALADVGISMGTLGSDIAIESSDVVFINDDPSKLIDAINISHKTMNIIKQNIIFAIGIKVLFLTLAAFGLTSMWLAVFADVGVSILAILNSMRAMKLNIKKR